MVLATGAALFYGTFDMPALGDPAAPAHHHGAPRYVEDSGTESGIPNVVTSVLASYRGYDTMGETSVILTAGSRRPPPAQGSTARRAERSMKDQPILRVFTKQLLP